MKKLMAWAIFSLALVLGVMAWVIYATQKTAAESVEKSLEGTQGLNTLAGQISRVLSSVGVQP